MPDLEGRLRSSLRSAEPDESVGRRLAAAIPDPLPVARRRRRRAAVARWLRPALGAAGLAILAALFVALLTVFDGGDAPDGSAAAPPPARYALLERPQTAQEAATKWIDPMAPLVPSSLRNAAGDDGYDYLAARLEAGGICIRRLAPNDAVIDECAAPTSPGLRVIAPYPESAEAPRRLFGLVPDAITAVEVNGQTIQPHDNIWNAELAPEATRIVVDFHTDDGVVADWREELALDPGAGKLLSQAPGLGVACRPGASSCDRVGLAVWLHEPARAVRAEVDGRSFTLNDPIWSGPARDGLRRMFAGFLEPAGLHGGALRIPKVAGGRWAGSPQVKATVTIEVVERDGSTTQATVHTTLAPGWG